MNKRQQKVGVCAYCGEAKPLTDDHIPPKSLFPTPRPSDLITVPSCYDCNAGFQKDDEYFRAIMVLWQETGSHREALRLARHVVRDLKRPEKTRFRRSLIERARPIPVFTKSGLYAGETGLLPVDSLRLHGTVIRIVKGLFYHHKGVRLPDSHEVQVRFSTPDRRAANFARATLPRLAAKPVILGNGVFKYWVEFSAKDEMASAWVLQFFEFLLFVCVTVPSGFTGAPRDVFPA